MEMGRAQVPKALAPEGWRQNDVAKAGQGLCPITDFERLRE